MTICFSVILPTFNREHRIQYAIESMLNQSYINWELIIIDDASTDETESIVQAFLSDSRIHYFKNERNQERCESRNRGIREAKGDYICFLDSDDYHLPNHLELISKKLDELNYPKAFLFTNAYNQSESEPLGVARDKSALRSVGEPRTGFSGLDSDDTGRTERVCPDYEAVDPYTYFLRYTVNPQRWCVHREVMLEHLFDPEVIICEDMDTSLRMVASGVPVFQIKERTTVYVAASDSFTHGDPKKWEKELFYLKRIFVKPVFKNKLPRKEKKRLFSMCYFHLSQISNIRKKKLYSYSLRSFLLYPSGYNGKTNKILLTQCLYNLPILGYLLQKTIRFAKRSS